MRGPVARIASTPSTRSTRRSPLSARAPPRAGESASELMSYARDIQLEAARAGGDDGIYGIDDATGGYEPDAVDRGARPGVGRRS